MSTRNSFQRLNGYITLHEFDTFFFLKLYKKNKT